jgi:hypothetical protein
MNALNAFPGGGGLAPAAVQGKPAFLAIGTKGEQLGILEDQELAGLAVLLSQEIAKGPVLGPDEFAIDDRDLVIV